MSAITPTSIAKFALSAVVALNVAKASRNAVDNYTEFDADSIPVMVGTAVAGQIVAMKLEPVTDAIVDKTVSWWTSRKSTPIVVPSS